MQPQRNRQDEFPSLLLRWKSRDLFWMISSVSMIISSCPRFRMFFPNCLFPILDDFLIIVIISPHVESLESQDSQVAKKPFLLSFSIIFLLIWTFRDQQSIISIYFDQIPPKLPQLRWSRFGQCILPSRAIKMASFPRQSLGRACALVGMVIQRGFPGHQKT